MTHPVKNTSRTTYHKKRGIRTMLKSKHNSSKGPVHFNGEKDYYLTQAKVVTEDSNNEIVVELAITDLTYADKVRGLEDSLKRFDGKLKI